MGAEKPLRPVGLQEVLGRVVERFKDVAVAKHVSLDCSSPIVDCKVRATGEGLDTVLSNVIDNAIKYTPEGGSVRVEAEEAPGSCILKVADTGIGIPEEDLPHLGEEFFRAKNAYQCDIPGTGLGLSIIREFLNRFGGQIEFQSRDGGGTTAILHLPLWTD